MRHTFSRKERLRSRKTIDALFARGRPVTVPGLRLLWIETENPETVLQVAFAVPRRNFRKATERNRIRRRMREAYRLQKHRVYNSLEACGKSAAVVVTFTGREVPAFEEVADKIIIVLQRFTETLCGKP